MADAAPKVSFVVIAFNAEQSIQQVIAAITAQELDASYEIIVVDDGSTDGTAGRVGEVAAGSSPVRLIRLPLNQGRGHARKVGAEAARGEYVAYVDADIILPPDWTSRCLAAIRQVDVVGGTAVPDGDVAYLCRRFSLKPKVVASTTPITGNNGMYRREVFEVVSFDPALREGEDVAFNHALDDAGLRSLSLDGLIVHHEESKTFLESLAWLYTSGRSAAGQFHRYHRLRLPDAAFAGWLGSCAVGAGLLRRRNSRAGLGIPLGYVAAASTAHVARRFVLRESKLHTFLGAVGTDMAFLTAYFLGRTTAHAEYVLRRDQP